MITKKHFATIFFSYSWSLRAVCTARTYSRSDLYIFNFLLRENKTKDRRRRMNRSFCSVLSIYFRSVCLVRKHGNNTIVLQFQGLVSCGTYTVLYIYNNANEVAQASHVTSTQSLTARTKADHASVISFITALKALKSSRIQRTILPALINDHLIFSDMKLDGFCPNMKVLLCFTNVAKY